jgi:zinc protease
MQSPVPGRFLAAAALTAGLLIAPPALPAADETPKPAGKPSPQKIVQRTVADNGAVVAKLSNGLTVIVQRTTSAPVVCVRAFVRAGGMYEKEYLGCGISHLVEHLVAKGAVHEGQHPDSAKPTDSRVSEIGGQSNASTSLARTQYYISAAASKTMDCIDLVADWLARPSITEADFRREHGVVQRELELGKDSPGRQMWYAHAADVFGSHPASVPIIGYAEPLRRLTYADVLTYHRRMYVPENLAFVIVGDVDPAGVLERTCRAFAGFERGRRPDLSLPAVQPLAGVRRTVRPHTGLKQVLQEMSFQTICLLHEDLYPLDVLSTVLTQGESSRLVAKIRRELRLVTQIDSSSWTPEWGTGMFNVSFRAEPDQADAAEKAILAELKAVVRDGVDADRLARAKRQMVSSFVRSQQSVESISSMLASDYLSTGDAAFSQNYTKRIQAVTAGQVHAAARKYFRFDRMAITRLVPPERFGAAASGGAAASAAAGGLFRLPNGLRVVLHSTDAVGLVSMAFVTTGGLLAETEQTNGLGALMAALSTKGAADRSADQIAAFFDRAGGSLRGSAGNNTFYWQATVLDDSFGEALEILADVAQRPTFPAKELEILRPVHLAAIDRLKEDWFPELQQFFRSRFFGDAPFGMMSIGRREVVRAATVAQIAAHHRRWVKAGDSVLAVYGRFDAKKARRRIEKLFADVPAGRVNLKVPPARKVAAKGERHVLGTEKKIAAVMVGAPGMKVDSEDRFAVAVLDTIISGYRLPSGWLHTELRGKRLVYVVHAYNWMGLAPGAFIVYAAGQPEKVPEVVRIIHRNLARAAEYRPTQKEIDRAVNIILTAELLQNQSMRALAMSAALDELYGFGYDFRKKLERRYREVTPDGVARVAKKYLGGGLVTTVATPSPKQAQRAEQKD